LLGVLILMASTPGASMPLYDATSARPIDEFATCFSRAMERGDRAWAYLPNQQGGTFTDSGARGIAATYWLKVRGEGKATRLRLFASAPATDAREAIDKCR
jgi:hypothetical protein